MELQIDDETTVVAPADDARLFGVADDEVREAANRARIAFCHVEQELVRRYIEVVDASVVSVSPLEGSSAPPDDLSHLGNVLHNYNTLLGERLSELQYQLDELEDQGIEETDD